jgi:2-polyprenyl-3-methyl-5-hydroxy-6-metoxy-1,4-benzoquinol methylase
MEIEQNPAKTEALYWDADHIGENYERVSHLVQDATYHGHLSIYQFAARFCQDARVLDAGSGAGYGAAYLAEAGARHVLGVDVSERAVAFSRYHFCREGLEFQTLNLEAIATLLPQRFDLIFCSNTLEHVPDVLGTLHGFWHLLEPTGTLSVVAAPVGFCPGPVLRGGYPLFARGWAHRPLPGRIPSHGCEPDRGRLSNRAWDCGRDV